MGFILVRDCVNKKGVREFAYLYPLNAGVNTGKYLKEYDKALLNIVLSDDTPCFLLYMEKFPSLITKVRSYKGLLKTEKTANFEKRINSKESYLGFCLKLNENNKEILFDYFFTPNNCCLIRTQATKLVQELKEQMFDFSFFETTDQFWLDYSKLLEHLDTSSYIYHFHVNPENENELGVKAYTSVK